jgi:hypothetical protein
MRKLLATAFLTFLVSSSQTASSWACSPYSEISPQSQSHLLGENASVDILVGVCGLEADVVFEVHGPHPHVESLETDGGILNYTYTYQGIVPGRDTMTLITILGDETYTDEAEVYWDPDVRGPLAVFFEQEESLLTASNFVIETADSVQTPNAEPAQCWVETPWLEITTNFVWGHHRIQCNQSVGQIWIQGTLRAIAATGTTRYYQNSNTCYGVSACSVGTVMERFRGGWTYHAFTTGSWSKDGNKHYLGQYRSACRDVYS